MDHGSEDFSSHRIQSETTLPHHLMAEGKVAIRSWVKNEGLFDFSTLIRDGQLKVVDNDYYFRAETADQQYFFEATLDEGDLLSMNVRLVTVDRGELTRCKELPRYSQLVEDVIERFKRHGREVKAIGSDWRLKQDPAESMNLDMFLIEMSQKIGRRVTLRELAEQVEHLDPQIVKHAVLTTPSGKVVKKLGFGEPEVEVYEDSVYVVYKRPGT